jgi:hypothetical protein
MDVAENESPETMVGEKQTFEERRSLLLKRQGEVPAERANLTSKLQIVTKQRADLQRNQNEDRTRIKAAGVEEAKKYINDSDGAFLHKVLQIKLVSPEYRVREQRIVELEGIELALKGELTTLNLEAQRITRDLAKVDCDEAAANICQWFADMQATIRLLQAKYEPGMRYLDTLKLRSEELATKNWTQRLTDAGVEEWQLSLLDNVMGDHRTSDVIEWLHNVSRSSCAGKNPFFRAKVTERQFNSQSVYVDHKGPHPAEFRARTITQ